MAKCQLLLIGVLALLVGDAAAGLASGLAGGLALTAAAVLGALAQGTSLKSLDSFHNSYLQSVDLSQAVNARNPERKPNYRKKCSTEYG